VNYHEELVKEAKRKKKEKPRGRHITTPDASTGESPLNFD